MGKENRNSHPLEFMRTLPRRRFLGFAAFTSLTVVGRDVFVGPNLAYAHSDDGVADEPDLGPDGLGGLADDELLDAGNGHFMVAMDCEAIDLMELTDENVRARALQVFEQVSPPYSLESASKGDAP